jgi:hypothetical protein
MQRAASQQQQPFVLDRDRPPVDKAAAERESC